MKSDSSTMKKMPMELTTKEQLEKVIQLTIEQNGELRTKRSKDKIKLKFRTKKKLYTFKLPIKEAESLIRDLQSKMNVKAF
ncbi:MAG: hypothetical protein ACTSVB_05890 [Candidatus Heimdallarchaeaceae archaeon]|uniref:50S ribosomal protein L38e n=1 Tax=Candidatus Heimdallarchaeum endolithica TaxID=2876572 RepID=A0A9Y1FNB2_9ARCH|nr:MAG: hypothetical protein K9W46_08740 [Candidatus Heimdallarchaeum endolithica]